MVNSLLSKLKESLLSILPITAIVLILGLWVTPVPAENLISFGICCVIMWLGIGLFTLGADISMSPMGQHMGSHLGKTNKVWLIVLCAFILGFIITIAEPDLSVLAGQVPEINSYLFIVGVSVGVGIFFMLSILRILFKLSYSVITAISYAIIFLLVIFIDQGIVPLAFDAGSVTTGAISVPFMVSLGVGLASVRGTGSKEDSFGLVGLASVGPVLSAIVLMWVMGVTDAAADVSEAMTFSQAFATYFLDALIVILPIEVLFGIFQIFALKLPRKQILKIVMGIFYSYIGIVLFLVAVNVGFLPIGKMIGEQLAGGLSEWFIPICFVIGFCMAMVEPAVHVLCKQIAEITNGMIKRKTILLCITFGVAVALALCAVRVLTHISILWILVPAYALVVVLSFFAPKLFVGIAFDAGGVATGTMATTFALPLIIGAVSATGGSLLLDAFGTLALCVVAPILVVMIFGIIYRIGEKRIKSSAEDVKGSVIIEYD